MKPVTEAQIEFGHRLGIDLSGRSINVALAMIEDSIDTQFHGRNDLGAPTPKQVQLALRFGQDISAVSRRVGNAIVDDILTTLNHEAIVSQCLAPDVVVVNKHDTLARKRVISSIREDGTVYLRGGNGARTWARNLVRVEK